MTYGLEFRECKRKCVCRRCFEDIPDGSDVMFMKTYVSAINVSIAFCESCVSALQREMADQLDVEWKIK